MNNIFSNCKNRYPFELILIFFLSLALFTFGFSQHEFIQFESRFGVFAQEMLRNGIRFFPTTYNKPYPDYPATQTILTYLFSLPEHKVTFLTAILPTALASSTCLVFIYLIGSLHSRLLGLYGVLLALFTFNFLAAARTITLDQFTCAATAACFYYAYSADLLGKKTRLWLIPFCWLLSFSVRGPIGLIIPASIVGIYYLLEKNIKALFITGISAIVMLMLCMAGLLGAAWLEGGDNLVQSVIHMQAMGRVDSFNSVPFYYYFTASFINYALAFPIALIIFIVYAKDLFKKTPDKDFNLLKLLAGWTCIILVGMSIPSDEKMRYILPMTPAISLAAAYLFYREHRNRFLNYLKNLLHCLFLLLPFISLLLITIAYIFSKQKQLTLEIPYFKLYVLFILLSVSTFLLWRKKSQQIQLYQFGIFSLGLFSFILNYALVAQPLSVQFNRAQPFVEKVETIRQPLQALVFYQIGPDGEDIKYIVAADKPIQPYFIQNSQDLIQFSQSAIFIAKSANFNQLPNSIKTRLHVLFTGRLGHQGCVVFEKIKTLRQEAASSYMDVFMRVCANTIA